MSDQKIVIHGYEYIFFISYMLFYTLNSQFGWKQPLIAHFAIFAKDGHS